MSGLGIEGVLDRHRTWSNNRKPATQLRWTCACGAELDDDFSGVNVGARHRAHVAAVLREQIAAAQAEAWDEGLNTGVALAARGYASPNPYRAALVACVDPSPSESGSTDPEVRQSADRTSSPSRVPGEET